MATLTDTATTFGVVRTAWERDRDEPVDLRRPAIMVVGGWVIMAWSRFGPQGFVGPRSAVRFILVGFYAWLALAVLIWLAGRWLTDRAEPADPVHRVDRSAVSPDGVGLLRVVQLTGHAHRPVVVLGLVIQFAAVLLQITGPGLVLAVAAFGLWMPAMLAATTAAAFDLSPARATVVVALPYLAWLATAGRFLERQVGHLL